MIEKKCTWYVCVSIVIISIVEQLPLFVGCIFSLLYFEIWVFFILNFKIRNFHDTSESNLIEPEQNWRWKHWNENENEKLIACSKNRPERKSINGKHWPKINKSSTLTAFVYLLVLSDFSLYFYTSPRDMGKGRKCPKPFKWCSSICKEGKRKRDGIE